LKTLPTFTGWTGYFGRYFQQKTSSLHQRSAMQANIAIFSSPGPNDHRTYAEDALISRAIWGPVLVGGEDLIVQGGQLPLCRTVTAPARQCAWSRLPSPMMLDRWSWTRVDAGTAQRCAGGPRGAAEHTVKHDRVQACWRLAR